MWPTSVSCIIYSIVYKLWIILCISLCYLRWFFLNK
nr:MAG TPA: hypothetical protein [Caudoviricetes sp.]DAV24035.1 MAG TPA: hypothetical protein [Bacteriophage sp.]